MAELSVKIKKTFTFYPVWLKIEARIRRIGDGKNDDMPSTFPGLKDGRWRVTINLASRTIEGWPKNYPAIVDVKACDDGIYTLLDGNGTVIHVHEGYVPELLSPKGHGYSLRLTINKDGKIENWPKTLDLSCFVADDP